MGRATVFRVLATVFAIAALQHLLGALDAHGDGSAGRHLVFVGINALVAVGLWRRPPFFAWVFVVLALQQLMSHGGEIVRAWTKEHRIDWLSMAVLAVVISTAVLLLRERLGTARGDDGRRAGM